MDNEDAGVLEARCLHGFRVHRTARLWRVGSQVAHGHEWVPLPDRRERWAAGILGDASRGTLTASGLPAAQARGNRPDSNRLNRHDLRDLRMTDLHVLCNTIPALFTGMQLLANRYLGLPV